MTATYQRYYEAIVHIHIVTQHMYVRVFIIKLMITILAERKTLSVTLLLKL